MKLSLPGNLRSEQKQHVPWYRLGGVLAVATLALLGEVRMVLRARMSLEADTLAVSLQEAENQRIHELVRRAAARSEALKATAEGILKGLLAEGQEEPDLGALAEAGLRVRGVSGGGDELRIKLLDNRVEYHTLLPALSRQEAATPFLRCTWLSLKTTGKPFHTSALRLQADFELAFPRLNAGLPASESNAGSK